MLSLLLAACGGDEPTNTPTPRATNTPTATPVPGQTVTPGPTNTPQPTATPEPGFDAEAYFKGKTIRMMVGFAPGGGTDAQGRFFAANWPKYIPGNPKMIVQNLTPVITERNFVWNAKPDGFTLGTEATPGVADMTESAAQFDMREVAAIGSTSGGENFWAIWHTLSYGCADTAVGGSDLIKLADGIAAWDDMQSTAFGVGLASIAMNLPLQLIHVAGDTGSNAQRLMLERGDVNSWSTATVWNQLPRTNPGWVKDGILKPFLDLSFTGVKQGPNTEGEFYCGKLEDYLSADDPDVKTFYKFNDVRSSFAKNIVGPPGMNPDVLNALRKALDDAMADPDFVTRMEVASGIPTLYTPGAKFEADLKRITDDFYSNQAEYDALRHQIYDTYVK
jgi:hypothetical protein